MNENLYRNLLPLPLSAKSVFCPAPFIQLLLDPKGHISPCCWMQDYHLGKIQNHSLKDIWNGEALQKLRNEFLTGDIITCKKMIDHIQCHKKFERFIKDLELKDTITFPPKRLDLRLQGKCNLACKMCQVWQEPNDTYTEANFWTESENTVFQHLAEIDLLGGEPFVQDSTYRLIREVSSKSPNCVWAISSNLNFRLTSHIQKLLDSIIIRWFQVSIDSLNEKTYSEIRRKGSLKKVLNTLDDLIKYRDQRQDKNLKHFIIVGSMCVQKDNWKEIPAFLQYCLEHHMKPNLQFAYTPHQLSLKSLPQEEKENVTSFLIDHCNEQLTQYIRPILCGLTDE